MAQELPRPSMARHEDNNTLPTTYNMKLGPVLFDVTGSVDSEFNDNIGLTNTGQKSDFIVTPEVGIGVRWPVTESNTLSFNTSLGYTHYLDPSAVRFGRRPRRARLGAGLQPLRGRLQVHLP